MTYYDTIAEDLARAKEILAKGRSEIPDDELASLPRRYQELHGGTIYGADTYAAYKLLESFVAEVERLQARVQELERDAERERLARAVVDEALRQALARVQELKHENITLADQVGPLVNKVQALERELAEAKNWELAYDSEKIEVEALAAKVQALEREVAALKARDTTDPLGPRRLSVPD